jgi:hypothetical protein
VEHLSDLPTSITPGWKGTGTKTFLLRKFVNYGCKKLNKHRHLFGLRAGDLKPRQEEHRFSSLVINFGLDEDLVLRAHRQILASQEFSGLHVYLSITNFF